MSCSGKLTSLSLGTFYSVESVDVTGTHAEDMTMTLYQDFSAPVPAGESSCGGLVA